MTRAARRLVRNPKVAVAAALLAAPILFFPRVFLLGEIFLLRDLFNWFYPWRVYAARSIAAGDFPLWNPHSYMGTPFLGNMQSGLLYPLNVPFWVMQFPGGMRCFLWAQCVLASWLMYRLLRSLSCRRAAALAGGFAWAYCGWMLVHIEFPNKFGAAGWLPLIVWGMVICARGRVARGVALAGGGVAGSILAGYPETTYMLILGAGFLWLCGAVAAAAALRRGQPGDRGALWRALLSLPAALLLGLALAAIQWMPFRDAVSQSDRGEGFDAGFVQRLSFSIFHFLDLALPHLYGLPGYKHFWGGYLAQYWLSHFYAGVITLVLAVLGVWTLIRRRRGKVAAADQTGPPDAILWSCLLLFAAGGLLAMGSTTPVASVAGLLLPGFAYVKWLPSFTLLCVFSLCVVAASGLDILIRRQERRRRRSRRMLVCAAAGAALFTVCALLAAVSPSAFESLVRFVVAPVAADPQPQNIGPNIGLVSSDCQAAAALLWGFVLVLLFSRPGAAGAAAAGVVIATLVFIDLAVASRGINVTVDPGIYSEVPEWTATLSERLAPHYRLYVPDETLGMDKWMYGSSDQEIYRAAADLMLFNQNLVYGFDSASDGDPIRSVRTLAWHDVVEDPNAEAARARLLSLAGVKVILQLAEDKRTHLVELGDAMPRAWLASGSRVVDTKRIMDEVTDPAWDPREVVLLEQSMPGDPPVGPGRDDSGAVRSIRYTNNTVTLETTSRQESWLVLTDTYAPGWECTVDAAPANIRQADFLFRAVRLPAGDHTVRFVYRPVSVRNGIIVTSIGTAVLAFLLMRDRRKRHAHQ